jgi:hypothetical protein
MSTIYESIAKERELLFDPLEQKPTVKQFFGATLREFQNFHNSLGLTSQPWSTKEFNITLNGGGDYLISDSGIGKVLFVTANNYGNYNYPVSVNFTDLSDLSNDWWFYNQAIDTSFIYYDRYPNKLAFFRKDGELYLRSNPNYYPVCDLTITAATGNWSQDASLQDSAVLSEYHHLPEIRAAKNLLPNCKWNDPPDLKALQISLAEQEARVYKDFQEAKRNLAADFVTYRGEDDEW